MSKPNTANKNNYVQDGRLTPDEMARERMKQGEMTGPAKSKEIVIGKTRSSDAPGSIPRRTGREE